MPRNVFEIIVELFNEVRIELPRRIFYEDDLSNPNENGEIKFDLNQYIHETDTPVSIEINEYKERTRSALALNPDLPEILNIYEKDGSGDFVTDKYGNYVTKLGLGGRFYPDNLKRQDYRSDYSRIVRSPVVEYDSENRVVTYRPIGDYQFNKMDLIMILKAGVFQPFGAAGAGGGIIQGAAAAGGLIVQGETSAKVVLSNAYGSNSAINPIVLTGPDLQDGTITEGDTKDKTVTIHFNDDTIYVGNERDTDLWQYQGMTNTCMFAAISSMINSYNFNRGSYRVVNGDRVWVPESWQDANGNNYYFPFDDNGRDDGVPVYFPQKLSDGSNPLPQELTIDHLVALSSGEITFLGQSLWNSEATIMDIILGRDDFSDLTPEELNEIRGIDIDYEHVPGTPALPAGITISAIANHFGIPVHTGRAFSLDILINELAAGNKLLMGIDPAEFTENLALLSDPESAFTVAHEPLQPRSDFSSDEEYYQYIDVNTPTSLLDRDIFASDEDYQSYLDSWGGEEGFYESIAGEHESNAIETFKFYGQVPDRSVFDTDQEYYDFISKVVGASPFDPEDFSTDQEYQDYLDSVGGSEAAFYDNSITHFKETFKENREFNSYNAMQEGTGGIASHAVWITAVEIPTDGSEPYVIINDSARAAGGGLRVPVRAFADIADDDGFLYLALGNSIPENDYLTQVYKDAYRAAGYGASVEDIQKWVNILDATYPNRVRALKEQFGTNLATAFEAHENNLLTNFSSIVHETILANSVEDEDC